MMRLGTAALVLLPLVGCGSTDRWDDVNWDLEETRAGRYEGTVGVEAQARAAFVPVRQVSCADDAIIELSDQQVASGTLSCDFGSDIGVLSIDMTGEVFQLPLIGGVVEGDVDGQALAMEWEGGFTSSEAFFGELSGEEEIEGFRVTFEGWFEVERRSVGNYSL